MSPNEQLIILSNMTASKHKQFKKALRVLLVIGIDQFTAIELILTGVKRIQESEFDRQQVIRAERKYA